MVITVQLYGVFRIGRYKESKQTIPAGSKVQAVVDHLQLSPELLGIILINGIHSNIDQVLKDGDRLSLLPVLDGG